MMDFKIGVGVRFIYNNTGLEWHQWQRPVYEWLQSQTLHCMPKGFREYPCFVCDDASDGVGIKAGIFTRLVDGKYIDVIIDESAGINGE